MMSNPAEHGENSSDSGHPRGANPSARTGAVPIFSADGPPQGSHPNPGPPQGSQPNPGRYPQGSQPSPGQYQDSQPNPGPPQGSQPNPGPPPGGEASYAPSAGHAGSGGVGPTPPTTDTIAEDVAHSLKGLAFHGAAFGLVFGLFFGATGVIAGTLTAGHGLFGIIVNTLSGGLMGALIALGCGKLLNIELKRKVRRTTNPAAREKVLRKGAILGRSEQVRVTAKSLVLFLIVSLVWAGGVALVTWIVSMVMEANGVAGPDITSAVSVANSVAIVLGIVLSLIRLVRFRRSGIYAGAAAVERVFHSAPGSY
jgi:hypothetical protein